MRASDGDGGASAGGGEVVGAYFYDALAAGEGSSGCSYREERVAGVLVLLDELAVDVDVNKGC